MELSRGTNENSALILKSLAAPTALLAILSLQSGIFYPAIIALAAAVHEISHLAVAAALRVNLTPCSGLYPGLCLSYDMNGRSYGTEIAVCAAGPLGGFAAAAISVALGAASVKGGLFFIIANLTLSFFNLLPSSRLDGGGILNAALHIFLPCYTADKIAASVSHITAVIIIAFGAAAMISLRANFSLALIAFYLAVCSACDFGRKITPKDNEKKFL